MTVLPPYVSRPFVQERLLAVFPEGSAFQTYLTREIAASTVFTMLYIGAVEGSGRLAGPKHIYRMGEDQAALTSNAARIEYATETLKRGSLARGKTWYADNSREPIRDETLRQGLVSAGAALEDKNLPTTSSRPRYALARDFAALFDPALTGAAFDKALKAWQRTHLTPAALARVELLRAGTATSEAGTFVEFPNGEGRRLAPGESSRIAKAVIEEFAHRFLTKPSVLWLSESGNKVVSRDDDLARRIGLQIDASKSLPDIILADLGADPLLLVFIEVVSTDGPVTEDRRRDLLALTAKAALEPEHVAFVTAFMDRGKSAFRKAHGALAWNAFVWFASEPHCIEAYIGGSHQRTLHQLIRSMSPLGS
jgi:hypothetical protein